MKALLIAAGVLLAGAACAQDAGSICRSFCDADAKACRRDVAENASNEVDPLIDFRGPRADKDDFTNEKHDQAVRSADRDRLAGSRKCGDTRMACRQKCVASAPAVAASATP